jgi:hypothetical protein
VEVIAGTENSYFVLITLKVIELGLQILVRNFRLGYKLQRTVSRGLTISYHPGICIPLLTVMGIDGAFGKTNFTSSNFCLRRQFCASDTHPNSQGNQHINLVLGLDEMRNSNFEGECIFS